MPLLTIGLLLVALGTVQSRSVRGTRLVALLFAVAAVAITAMTVIFTLSSLVALGVIPPEQLSVLKRIVARTIATSIVYVTLYVALAITVWRRTRIRVLGRRQQRQRQVEAVGTRDVARDMVPQDPVHSHQENSRP
jgi:type VI protein secretion system component VasK